jgi:cytochrome c-type biogenesis protein CcmH/NrfG
VSLEGLVQYFSTFSPTLAQLERMEQSGEMRLPGWSGFVVRDFLVRKRIFSVFGWPNLFAGFLLLTMPMAAGLAGSAPSRRARAGWIAAGLLLAICLALTLSMGAWISLVLSGMVAYWLTTTVKGPQPGRVWRPPALPVLLALGLGVCLLIILAGLMVSARGKPLILSSISSRLVYALGALNVMRHAPMTGTGLGTFGLSYWALIPEPFAGQHHSALHAHNTLLEVGAELGLVGLASFLFFLRRVFQLITAATRAPTIGGWLTIRWGLGAGLLAFFVHSIIEQTFFETATAPLWWFALGLLTGIVGSGNPINEVGQGHAWAHRVIRPLSWVVAGVAAVCLVGDSFAVQAAHSQRHGRVQETVTALQSAGHWNPLEHRYPLELGVRLMHPLEDAIQIDEARVRLAIPAFQAAVARSPWLGYAWMRLGEAQWHLGMLEAATASLQEAVRRDPNLDSAALGLGHLLSQQGRHAELGTVARRLQRLAPANPLGYFWEGNMLQATGYPGEAVLTYLRILQHVPGHAPSLLQVARFFRSRGAVPEAARYYGLFLASDPGSAGDVTAEGRDFLQSLGVAE